MDTNIQLFFQSGYAGNVEARVYVGRTKGQVIRKPEDRGTEYVLELPAVVAYLEKMIEEKGYMITQSKKQKYPRININL